MPIDGQNGFPGQSGAVGPRGIPGVPGCNGSKVKTNERDIAEGGGRMFIYMCLLDNAQYGVCVCAFFFPLFHRSDEISPNHK